MMAGEQQSLFDTGQPADVLGEFSVGGVIVREVRCRSLLNRCGIGDYSFNCYVGCGHGCGYCYARFMQRFHPHAEAWGAFVDVRINAPAVLARQVRRLPPGCVFTCSACDGWQPIEERYRLTRRCCELLLNAGFELTVLTKSRLVLRDLDIFAGRPVQLGVTITTPDESWARVWEPGASSVADRIEVLRQAKAAGLRTETYTSQADFLVGLLQRAASEPEAFDGWDAQALRQFKTLTHPEHLGRAFRVLVQTRAS